MSQHVRFHLQLWGSVLSIFRSLLLTHPTEIPEHDLAIVAGTRKHRLFERMPRQGRDRIRVELQRVHLGFQIAQVPHPDGFVRRARRQQRLGCRVECDGIDRIAVLTFRRDSCASGLRVTNVQDLQSDIVGNGADERRMQRMILNVVDDGGMVSVGADGLERLVPLDVRRKVPIRACVSVARSILRAGDGA